MIIVLAKSWRAWSLQFCVFGSIAIKARISRTAMLAGIGSSLARWCATAGRMAVCGSTAGAGPSVPVPLRSNNRGCSAGDGPFLRRRMGTGGRAYSRFLGIGWLDGCGERWDVVLGLGFRLRAGIFGLAG